VILVCCSYLLFVEETELWFTDSCFKIFVDCQFLSFLIEKCNCTADKRLNWHWYLPTAWSSMDVQRCGLSRKGNGIIIVMRILA